MDTAEFSLGTALASPAAAVGHGAGFLDVDVDQIAGRCVSWKAAESIMCIDVRRHQPVDVRHDLATLSRAVPGSLLP